MSEGAISQEEIDALLSGVDIGGLNSGGGFSSKSDVTIDIETLQKFVTKLKDKFSDVLKEMTKKDVSIGAATVESSNRDQMLAKLPEVVVSVETDYTTALTGDHLYVISPEFATKLVGLITQEESPALDDMAMSVISEVISSHSGAEITELSITGKLPGLATQPPTAVNQPKAMVRIPQNTFALYTYPITLDGEAYTLWEAVSNSVADGVATALGGGSSVDADTGSMEFTQQSMGNFASMGDSSSMGQASMNGMMGGMQQMPMNGMMGGMQQMPMNGMMGMQQMPMNGMMGMQQMPMNGMMGMQQPPNVQSLQFPNLQHGVSGIEQGNIGLIMDVFMEVTVELGRKKRTIKDILSLSEGTIIELDKTAGEPVDILVNHKTIAKGEVVVIDENFGVRVTEILPAIENVSSSL